MKDKNFAGLDLLRFFAAMTVCLYHVAFLSWAKADSSAAIIAGNFYRFDDFSGVLSVGWIGVEIFFVISGFVITFSADGSAWKFLRSRILRLYPAVWFCAPIALFISLCLDAFPLSEAPTRIVRSSLLWPKGNWVDGVYWTLGIEMSFYFLVYLLLKFAPRRSIIPMLVCLGTVSSTYWLGQFMAQSVWGISIIPEFLRQGGANRYMELSLIPHGCFFAIGGLAWNVLCNGRSRWLWLAIGFCTLGAVVEIQSANEIKQSWTGISTIIALPQLIWIASMVFLWVSVAKRDWMAQFIPVAAVRSMGKMTYPFYLLHTTVGCAVLFEFGLLGANRWVALAASLFITLVASYAVAQMIEPAIKNTLAKILDARLSSTLKMPGLNFRRLNTQSK